MDRCCRASAPATAAVAALAILSGSAASPSVRLQPGRFATLHINQLAVIELPTRPPASVIASAGESLVLVRQRKQRDKAVLMYRAVRAGNHTLLVTPDNIPNGHCISCVTEHYFVTVVP